MLTKCWHLIYLLLIMGSEERNFRSSYYEKVGCFSVEEKKSLKKLLQDDIRNLNKLKQFCLSYSIVPSGQRNLLWCLIMRILPLHKKSTDYVRKQLKEVYDDLHRAVTVMGFIEAGMRKDTQLHKMWLLENNRLIYYSANLTKDDEDFMDIVRVLQQIFEDDTEIYWIAKKFYDYTKEIQKDCVKLKELTQTLLKREDIALFHHLEKLSVFDYKCKLLDKWYTNCFAGIISEVVLIKVWDKICGGSRKVIVFLFLELVKDIRHLILNCSGETELKVIIEKVKDKDAVIVNRAIKTWQSNKNHGEIDYLH